MHMFAIRGSLALLSICIAHGLKPEQTVRRGPGSDPQCMSPLFSSHEEFPDNQFTASSVLENRSDFQAHQARMIDVYGTREHTSGFAWCPNRPVGDLLQEWIQAEFTTLVMIKSIFTAGRGDGNVREFMPNFVLRYQREDDGVWYEHIKRDGSRVLKANSDPRNLARATLDSVVIAKRFRIYPYSREREQNVCLRFALYGCEFPDGVVSYSTIQGGLSMNEGPFSTSFIDQLDTTIIANLRDLSYDGQHITTSNELKNGLGQLLDNVAFLGNLTRESDLYPSQPGFHFIGWHAKENDPVQILFKFDQARHFTWLRLFTFDSIPLRIRLFSQATIEFSMDGVHFTDDVRFSTGRVMYFSSPDGPAERTTNIGGHSIRDSNAQNLRMYTLVEYDGAVVVELPLAEKVGRYLRLSLTPTDSWIVLSEVQFNSTVAKHVPTKILPPIVESVSNVDDHSSAFSGKQRTNQEQVLDNQESQSGKMEHGNNEVTVLNPKNMGGDVVHKATLHNIAPRDKPNRLESMDVDEGNDKMLAILPVIITTSVLLLLLPTVILIWFCSRRHLKKSRCRHKINMLDGGRHCPPLPGPMDAFVNGRNAMTADELAKLLGSYSTAPLNSQSEGIPTTNQFGLAQNGAILRENSTINVLPNFQVNHLIPNRNSIANVPAPLGAMHCSPNSSGSNLDPTVNLAAMSSVITSSTTPMNFINSTESPANIYTGADGSCMSLSSCNQVKLHPQYMPAFIALPPVNGNGGAFIIHPFALIQPSPSQPSLNGLVTPDSGSLYASVRASFIHLGQSLASDANSEFYVQFDPEKTPIQDVRQLAASSPQYDDTKEPDDTDNDVTDLDDELVEGGNSRDGVDIHKIDKQESSQLKQNTLSNTLSGSTRPSNPVHSAGKNTKPVKIASNSTNLFSHRLSGPEYASASIFGYSPPPSESASNPPPTCMESMPPTDYYPNIVNYALSTSQTMNGINSNAIYTGPVSLPIVENTLREILKHNTSNTLNRHPSGDAITKPGIFMLPQAPIGVPRADDQLRLYPTVTAENFNLYQDRGQFLGLYQANLMNAALHNPQVNHLEPWHFQHALANNPELQNSIWLSNNGCTSNYLVNNHPFQPIGNKQNLPNANPIQMPFSHTSPSGKIGPNPGETIDLHINPTASSSSTHLQGRTNGASKREGTNPNRLSLYSMCT